MAYASLGPVTGLLPDPLKGPAKRAYSRALSLASERWHASYDADSTLLIMGSPRSGTTWLMDVVCALPGTCPIFEPLNIAQDPALKPILHDEWVRLGPDDKADALEGFLRRLFAGHHFTPWSASYTSIRRILAAERFVVKFVRVTRATGWLSRRFPRNKKLLIIRHPCAVVWSMITSPGPWHEWSVGDVSGPIRALFGRRSEAVLTRITTREQILSAYWCADVLTAITETSPGDILLLTYEELVNNPYANLSRLFRYLREPIPPAAIRELYRPSGTANRNAAIRVGEDCLTAWCHRMQAYQARRVLEVVDAFGIDFYGSSPMPDLAKLADEHATRNRLSL